MKRLIEAVSLAVLAVAVSANAAVVYLDETGPATNGANFALSNTPMADAWYISGDYTLAVPADWWTWAGISLYTADGEAQFFGRGGGSSLSVGTVKGGGSNSEWIDLTDDGAEPSNFHLTMQVDTINQTVKLWLDGLQGDMPDYEGVLPNASPANFAQLTNVTFWAEGDSSVANVLISDSADGHFVPEPATMSLLGFGALALLRRNRKQA